MDGMPALSSGAIRDALAGHGEDLARLKVKSLGVLARNGILARRSVHDIELVAELDWDRSPTMFDLLALEEYLGGLFGRDVGVMTADTLRPDEQGRLDREAVRVF